MKFTQRVANSDAITSIGKVVECNSKFCMPRLDKWEREGSDKAMEQYTLSAYY